MATKTPHKRLQRLTEDEIHKRPKLQFCLRLMQANPKRETETHEEWAARVYLNNTASLIASAESKEKENYG